MRTGISITLKPPLSAGSCTSWPTSPPRGSAADTDRPFDDVVERTVGQTFSDAYGYDPVDPIVVRGVPLEQCPLGLKRSAVAAAWSDEVENRLGERLRLLLKYGVAGVLTFPL